ncbi:MAG: hypothetical protein WAO76_04400 [Georgfuchsia sp.]
MILLLLTLVSNCKHARVLIENHASPNGAVNSAGSNNISPYQPRILVCSNDNTFSRFTPGGIPRPELDVVGAHRFFEKLQTDAQPTVIGMATIHKPLRRVIMEVTVKGYAAGKTLPGSHHNRQMPGKSNNGNPG